MTDIIFHEAQFSKDHKITFVPKKLKELHIHFAGEDGQFLWMELVTEDGNKQQTGYYKENY